MRTLTRIALVTSGLLVVAPALVGCSGSKTPTTGTPTPTAGTSSGGPADAAGELARLAALSARSTYAASYRVTGAHPGVARVARTAIGYRFELRTGTGSAVREALLIRTPSRTVSCTLVPAPVTCLQVAGAGKPVPTVFDAGLQHVFSDYLVLLSKPNGTYSVTGAVGTEAEGECFDVALAATPAPSGTVAPGAYCFGLDGIPTRVSYPSGSLVLTAREGAPTSKDWVPPASPKPLP